MSGFVDNGGCFVCGPKNPVGLKLDFHFSAPGFSAETELTFPSHFQGWDQVIHGGLLATVLDEVMVKAASSRDMACVTGEMTIKYLRPASPDTPYRLRGVVTTERGKLLTAEGTITDKDETVIAKASAKLIRVG